MFDVPAGWNQTCLGDLADILCSNVDKKSRPAPEIAIKLCNYRDVYHNDMITFDIAFMSATATNVEVNRFSIRCGDVVITKDSESPADIAVPAYVSDIFSDVVCGYHLAIIRSVSAQVSGAYLHQLFGLQAVRAYYYLYANGITRFGLTKPMMHAMPVIYPSRAEQQRIVNILQAIDHLIELYRAQCKKLNNLKKGLLQTILQQDLPGLEASNTLPMGWCIRRLGETVTLVYGKTCRKPMAAYGQYPVLGANGVIGYTDDYLFDGVSIILGRKGTINKPYYTKGPCWVIDTAFYLQDFQNVCPRWLYYVLVALDLSFYNEATGVPSLSRETLYGITYKHPPLEEQQQMANTLLAVDQHIIACEARLNHYRKLKEALRQDLLTGKVRTQPSNVER